MLECVYTLCHCTQCLVMCFKCLCCASGFGTVLQLFVVDILQRRMRPIFSQTQYIRWIINWIALQIWAINAQLSEKIRLKLAIMPAP